MNDNDVKFLRDRIAAAIYRGDAQYACSIIEHYTKEIEDELRGKIRKENEALRDDEIVYSRSGNAYFETRDGLRVLDSIGNSNGYWPPRWNRVCLGRNIWNISSTTRGEDFLIERTETRTYELLSLRAPDGRPIYREI